MVVSALGVRLAPPKMTLKQYSYLSLVIVYTSSMTFLMKRSRVRSPESEGLYSIPTSVFLAEVLKLAVSLAVEQYNRQTSLHQYMMIEERSDTELEGGLIGTDKDISSKRDEGYTREKITRSSSNDLIQSTNSPQETGWNAIIKDVHAPDCWKLSIPAALYVAQSLLQMVAIQSVSAVTYQAVTQCKLLATTLLSVWLLSRLYSQRQWISIFVLLLGVIICSVSKIREKSPSTPSLVSSADSSPFASNTISISQQRQDAIVAAKLLGVLGVLAACTLGSGAAVYMEKVLKSDIKTSLWIRNAQLSLFSLIPAVFAVLYESYKKDQFAFHPLQYFGYWAWSTVIARSIGGFLIAFILKQTDALLKGIATSIAMILSIFVESILYNVPISPSFAFGAFLVVASSCLYVRSRLKA